jgi:glycosyltransferase involved in cell wall biosynthesis
MKTINTTFLFIKRGMLMGGIEINMMRFISWLINNNYRVVFLALKGSTIDNSFKNIFDSGKIDIYELDIDQIFCDFSAIKFCEGENVLAYSFDFYHYIILDKMKSYFKKANINSFFWLAHYQGYYPEEYFPRCIQKLLKPLAKRFIYGLEKNNNIIYLHDNHLLPFTKHYGYKVCNNGLKKVFYDVASPLFDLSLMKDKYYSKTFEIITIGRIIFPHKGYMVGLVKAFARLKHKYDNLLLTIIGDGRDKARLLELINSFDSNVRSSIRLLGTKSFDEIRECCKTARLNISLAGGVEAGGY